MKKYALLLLPLGAGFGLAALWRAGVWPNVILYLRADVATLFLLVGVTGAVLVGVGATNVKRVMASMFERVPRPITSAHGCPTQRASLGKVKAVRMLPASSATAAA